jgi:hypothetical protein
MASQQGKWIRGNVRTNPLLVCGTVEAEHEHGSIPCQIASRVCERKTLWACLEWTA